MKHKCSSEHVSGTSVSCLCKANVNTIDFACVMRNCYLCTALFVDEYSRIASFHMLVPGGKQKQSQVVLACDAHRINFAISVMMQKMQAVTVAMTSAIVYAVKLAVAVVLSLLVTIAAAAAVAALVLKSLKTYNIVSRIYLLMLLVLL